MLKELRRDHRRKRLVPSPRLSPEAKKRFPKLLEAAIEDGDDASLAARLPGPEPPDFDDPVTDDEKETK